MTASTAFNASAPADERADALGELQAVYAPRSESGLVLPMGDLAAIAAEVKQNLMDMEMAKAQSNIVPFPSRNAEEKKRGMQSVYLDDLQLAVMGDWWERPSALSYDSMRQMVEQTPVLNAVVMTRVRQVQSFCRVQESGQGAGFIVRHVDRDHQLTATESESVSIMQQFFTNCGFEFNPRKRRTLKRDGFATFMGKSVRDSLIMDSAPIETEMKRDRDLGIDGIYAVDGSTIRLCTEQGYQGDDEYFALQVVQGRIRTAYTRDTLILESRNPRTDVLLAGYGLSEVELLVRVVTGFLNAMSLNIRGFSDNSLPRGVMHLTGNYSQDDLVAFRRYWNSMVKGVNNAWSVPVLVSKDQESKASFENFGIQFDEMYFSKWMTFLTSMICAVYGMSPDEINFESFAASRSSLSGSDTAEKLADSKDKGLRPVLAYYEGLFSDYVLSAFDEKYCFRWTGLDEADEDKKHELKKMVLTVNEVRAQEGYDKMDSPIGEAPMNPSLIGPWMQVMAAQEPEEFGGQQEPGADDAQQGEDGDAEQEPGNENNTENGEAEPQDAGGPGKPPEGGEAEAAADEEDGEPFGKSWAFLKSEGNPNHDKIGRFSHSRGERKGLLARELPAVVVVHSTGEFAVTDKEKLKQSAIKKLKSWPKCGVSNVDSGWKFSIGRDDWKKIAAWSGQSIAGLHAIGGLEDIVGAAVLAETHDDKNSNPNVFAVHRFYAPVEIDGALHRVKLTVKDYVLTDGKERKNLHALEAIELESPGERLSQGPQGTQIAAPPAQAPGGEVTMAWLLSGVKRDGDGLDFGSSHAGEPIHKSEPVIESLDFGTRESAIYRLGDV